MVPVLEDALELNLPKLMRAGKAAASGSLVLDDGAVRAVVLLSETRLAAFLGDRAWVADIVAVACLGGRLRPLLKCPRAHEGNFQSLYFANGVLACRHCHGLRYQTNLAASAVDRARIARIKLLSAMGLQPGAVEAPRQPYKWRSRHWRQLTRLERLSRTHHDAVRGQFGGSKEG